MQPQWVKRRRVLPHQLYAVTLAIRRLSSNTLIAHISTATASVHVSPERVQYRLLTKETNIPKEQTFQKGGHALEASTYCCYIPFISRLFNNANLE